MLVYICSSTIYPRDILTESKSSPGKEYITVTPTLFNDAVCGCPGYHFRGTCKHVNNVYVCDWWEPFDNEQRYEFCPVCKSKMEVYETEPRG